MPHLVLVEITHVDAVEASVLLRETDGLTAEMDVDIVQCAQLLLQHLVGAHLRAKLQHSHMIADSGQVDGRFHATVSAADDCHVLAFVERPVAVRAEMNAVTNELVLTCQSQTAPSGTRGNDHTRGDE